MEAVTSGPNLKELVRIPALIALVVTLARLVGELSGGPARLFNSEPGGPGALVGIVWLVPIFGIYFSLKLARSGHAPQSAGKVIGFSVLALLAAAAIMFSVVKLTGDPNVSVSLRGVVGQQLGFGVASIVSLLILRRVWVPFFQTILRYAFASRVPVLIVMFVTMIGGWGTHYELPPPPPPPPPGISRNGIPGEVCPDRPDTPADLLDHVYRGCRQPRWWNRGGSVEISSGSGQLMYV